MSWSALLKVVAEANGKAEYRLLSLLLVEFQLKPTALRLMVPVKVKVTVPFAMMLVYVALL